MEKAILYFILAGLVWFVNVIIWVSVHGSILHGYQDSRPWNILHAVMLAVCLALISRGIWVLIWP